MVVYVALWVSGIAAGGCNVMPRCCCPWECWCCRPRRFTPSSPCSSSPSSTCCLWRPTSPLWVKNSRNSVTNYTPYWFCCSAVTIISDLFSILITIIKPNFPVFQYSFDNKTDNFDDMPARFGYRLPSDGLKVSECWRVKGVCTDLFVDHYNVFTIPHFFFCMIPHYSSIDLMFNHDKQLEEKEKDFSGKNCTWAKLSDRNKYWCSCIRV